jgi:hypothetical protein
MIGPLADVEVSYVRGERVEGERNLKPKLGPERARGRFGNWPNTNSGRICKEHSSAFELYAGRILGSKPLMRAFSYK